MKKEEPKIPDDQRELWRPPENKEVLFEFGTTDEDLIHIVTKAFFLRVKNGPLQLVRPSQRVRLTPETGAETFFSRKTEPLEVSEIFEVVRRFQWTENGNYINLEPGDSIRLTREEAINLLRSQTVKERR